MPRKAPKDDPDGDRERVLKVLREIVDAPAGTGSQAARYAAAQKLARLTGIEPDVDEEPVDAQAPDPMADLDEMEYWRRKRARKGNGPRWRYPRTERDR